MVLVRVGEHDTLDAVGVVTDVREIRQDEVDPGHVGVGKHQTAVHRDGRIAIFDQHHI